MEIAYIPADRTSGHLPAVCTEEHPIAGESHQARVVASPRFRLVRRAAAAVDVRTI